LVMLYEKSYKKAEIGRLLGRGHMSISRHNGKRGIFSLLETIKIQA